MEMRDRYVVITGAASGIGAALARRFAIEGAAHVVVADLDGAGARRVADEIGGLAVETDVTDHSQLARLVRRAEAVGPIDLFCSNAGVFGGVVGVEASPEQWDIVWRVNVLAHVEAARLVLPAMLDRGAGYLLNTASGAGLLTNPGAMPYSVSKHAAVAAAEWMSMTYGHRGIVVSCLCPQGVNTPMLTSGGAGGPGSATLAAGSLLEPEDVADAVVAGLRTGEFLILPSPGTQRAAEARVVHKERWLATVREIDQRLAADRDAAGN